MFALPTRTRSRTPSQPPRERGSLTQTRRRGRHLDSISEREWRPTGQRQTRARRTVNTTTTTTTTRSEEQNTQRRDMRESVSSSWYAHSPVGRSSAPPTRPEAATTQRRRLGTTKDTHSTPLCMLRGAGLLRVLDQGTVQGRENQSRTGGVGGATTPFPAGRTAAAADAGLVRQLAPVRASSRRRRRRRRRSGRSSHLWASEQDEQHRRKTKAMSRGKRTRRPYLHYSASPLPFPPTPTSTTVGSAIRPSRHP
jgi:hypothetical protein